MREKFFCICTALILLCGCETSYFQERVVAKEMNIPLLEDYLGDWSAPLGVIHLTAIKGEGADEILLHVQKAGPWTDGAWATRYYCKYDKKSGCLICNNQKHFMACSTCKEFNSWDNWETFRQCAEEFPDLVEVRQITQYGNEPLTIKIKRDVVDESFHDNLGRSAISFSDDPHLFFFRDED